MKLNDQVEQVKRKLSKDITDITNKFIEENGRLDIIEIRIRIDQDNDLAVFIRTDETEIEHRLPVWRKDGHRFDSWFEKLRCLIDDFKSK